MRYLIQSSFKDEISARKKYLYNSLKLWFWRSTLAKEYLILYSMPTSIYSDYLFIVGHNSFVKSFLTGSAVPEKTIVAITCDGMCNFRSLILPEGKKLFLPFLNKAGMAELLDGRQFGFEFDITESELQFFNSPKAYSLDQRIQASFVQFL